MQANVRLVVPEDYSAWQTLWQEYLAFCQCELAPDITTHLWQQFFHENRTIYAFVVENSQGQVGGFVHCVIHPNTWSRLPCCYLEDLYVAPKSRGVGLARTLIEHVRKFAQAMPCHRLYWVSRHDNRRANQLYNQLAQRMDFIQYRMPLTGVDL